MLSLSNQSTFHISNSPSPIFLNPLTPLSIIIQALNLVINFLSNPNSFYNITYIF